MSRTQHSVIRIARLWTHTLLIVLACAGPCLAGNDAVSPGVNRFRRLLQRTGDEMSEYVEKFSDVRCNEKVVQEKFKNNGKDKIDLREESTYDYLLILSNTGGELTLSESRLAVHEAKADKKNRSLLVSNGFATLFLVFHPLYANSFEFTELEDEVVDGQRLTKVAFQHIRGSRTPAALALRGREYPLELAGTAWIDPETSAIRKINAGIGASMADVGLSTLHTEVEFAPYAFHDPDKTYWFPARAVVEVETPRQHWRNTHEFTNYKRFSVSTEEQVTTK
jgi:hypothetical protein